MRGFIHTEVVAGCRGVALVVCVTGRGDVACICGWRGSGRQQAKRISTLQWWTASVNTIQIQSKPNGSPPFSDEL